MDHPDKSQKRKPEEPSTEDTQQKKPKESQEEIKLALTAGGFSEDVRRALEALETRNANRMILIAQLWEFWKKCTKDGIRLKAIVSSDDGLRWVSRWLLKEAKEEKEIAAVLAVCALITEQLDGCFEEREMLIIKGLADPLAVIIKSHLDQADIVERGLIIAVCIAYSHVEAINILTSLGFVSTLEKIAESYSNNHDIMWRACEVCRALTAEWEEGNEAIDAIKESKLPKLLEQVKVIFPADTYAHRDAKWTLEQLE